VALDPGNWQDAARLEGERRDMGQDEAKDRKVAGITDAAVRKATDAGWDEWIARLDGEGAADLGHREIATRLREEHGVSAWWAQTITGGYERERLGRGKHEMPDGYQVSATRTIAVGVDRLYRAVRDGRVRRRWLEEPIEIRKATPERSLRITWTEDGTHVDAHFEERGAGKSRIRVLHRRLPDAGTAESRKAFWKGRLAALKGALEP
jgi:uncharacterized protein YndB with AHSA1/START domain